MNIKQTQATCESPVPSLGEVSVERIIEQRKAEFFAFVNELWRNRWRIIISVIAGLMVGLSLLLFLPKWYVSEAVLQLDLARDDVGKAKLPVGAAIEAAALIEGESRILRSSALLTRVVNRLGLDKDPAFGRKEPLLSRLIQLATFTPAQWTTTDRAAAELAKAAIVTNDARSYLISITATADSPEKAANIANTLAYEYFDNRRVRHLRDTEGVARGTLADLKVVYGDKHPAVTAAAADLALAEARANEAVSEVGVGNLGPPKALPAGVALAAKPMPMPAGPTSFLPVITAIVGGMAAGAWILWNNCFKKPSMSEGALANATNLPRFGTVSKPFDGAPTELPYAGRSLSAVDDAAGRLTIDTAIPEHVRDLVPREGRFASDDYHGFNDGQRRATAPS